MAIPAFDLACIQRYCATRVPPQYQDAIRIEHRVGGKTVTIVECRPPWRPDLGPEWDEIPQVRIKYDDTTAAWTLYWFDSNSKSHRCDLIEPHQPVSRILAEIELDSTASFWG